MWRVWVFVERMVDKDGREKALLVGEVHHTVILEWGIVEVESHAAMRSHTAAKQMHM